MGLFWLVEKCPPKNRKTTNEDRFEVGRVVYEGYAEQTGTHA